MKYLRLNSVTWWGGFTSLAAGVVIGVSAGVPALAPVASIAEAFYPGVAPGMLVSAGLAVIGLREAPGIAGK